MRSNAGQPSAAIHTRRDRLKQLRAFREVVRADGVSRAAEALNSSQPAVSNYVRSLEKDLGTALFFRQGGRMRPTPYGRHLYEVMGPVVEGLLRLPAIFEEEHLRESIEAFRIGVGQYSGGLLLPGIVRQLQASLPRVRVQLRTGTGTERLAWLRSFEVDVVVAAIASAPPDIEFFPLVESDVVVVTSEDHPLGRRKQVVITDCAEHPMVVPSAGTQVRIILNVMFGMYGMRPNVALEVDRWDAMINHVAAGTGIAIVPDLSVNERAGVCKVPLVHPYRSRIYGVAVRRDGLRGLAARQFLEIVGTDATRRKQDA